MLIEAVVDPCTVKVDRQWSWRSVSGRNLRIVGLMPTPESSSSAETRRMQEHLVGKRVRYKQTHFVETGPTLVAGIEVEGISLREFFGERYVAQPPKSRLLDPNDTRTIRPVHGAVQEKWTNPLRALPEDDRPFLGNLPFPTDAWVPGYQAALKRITRVFCGERRHGTRDATVLADFLRRRVERTLLLFGPCGCGKSWFVRHHILTHPPDGMDVAFIDAASFPNGGYFEDRLHLRLGEVLGELVNKRKGGLKAALRAHLERETQGIFPGLSYDDPQVQSWCDQYLEKLPFSLASYNTLRLASYAYHDRSLLLVVDNIDGFSEADQGKLADIVLDTVTMHPGVYLILPLRPSSEFFSARLGNKLQHLLREHILSPVMMIPMIRKRMTTTASGRDITTLTVKDPGPVEGEISMIEVLNHYLKSEEIPRLLADLSQDDARHYIRLFRRFLYSDELGTLINASNIYYCVAALMLRRGEGFDEDTTFILNVFDNEHPSEEGNALIRWRVLEHFLIGYDRAEGELLEYYFTRLGYDLRRVQEVIDLWARAGALEMHNDEFGTRVKATVCGYRYERLIANLWYCICIKTGMNMDTKLILSGDEAVEAARGYGFTASPDVEWVPDDAFLQFLADEEALEEMRVSSFPGKTPELEDQCRRRGPASIHGRLWFEYAYQRRRWESRRG